MKYQYSDVHAMDSIRQAKKLVRRIRFSQEPPVSLVASNSIVLYATMNPTQVVEEIKRKLGKDWRNPHRHMFDDLEINA